jgi:hypothetical protein
LIHMALIYSWIVLELVLYSIDQSVDTSQIVSDIELVSYALAIK